MKIGDRIYITEELKMNNKIYPIGHQFVIIGSSPRGWDIKDDEGNTVYETLFITTDLERTEQSLKSFMQGLYELQDLSLKQEFDLRELEISPL